MGGQERARAFLQAHGMAGMLSPEAACQAYRAEMIRGLRGEESSLMMLPAYLSLDHDLPRQGQAVAMDMGGTNFRTALVELDGGAARMSGTVTSPTPGSVGRVSRGEFLDVLAGRLAGYPAGSPMGFCFSFPAEITPELDGKVLLFDKEVRVDGGAGMYLCRELSAHMKAGGQTPPAAGSVINDTVATLLGGYLTMERQAYDGFVGFILGTGLNCCYCERMENIAKLPGGAEGTMIVNMEAGGYSGFPQGRFDQMLDRASDEPGRNRFEKMTSGAYLGPLMELTLKGAAAEGVFSPRCAAAAAELSGLALSQVSPWLDGADGDAFARRLAAEGEDRQALEALLDGLVDRAAGQIAAFLTAVILQGDMGRSADRPAAIVTEGSTFHKFRRYRERIGAQMEALCGHVHGRSWRFVSAENANLYGAAAAALLRG